MSLGIEKLTVYDDRVFQQKPKYANYQGGVSYTNGKFRSISSSTSQLTFQATIPSQNVFVDRAIDIGATCYFGFTLTTAGTNAPDGQYLLPSFGNGMALCQLPLNSLISVANATINDTTVSFNSSDILREVLLFNNLADIKKQRTCPTMSDIYCSYDDAVNTNNNPLSDFTTAVNPSNVPNGAFFNVFYTDSLGNVLSGNGSYTVPASGGPGAVTVGYTNGIPRTTNAQTVYPLFFKFTSVEKLVLSPFIFAENDECETALFGIECINFTLNLVQPSLTGNNGRVLRSVSQSPNAYNAGGDKAFTLSNLSFNQNVQGGPIQNAEINMLFITPPLGLSLPESSCVPMHSYPRYIDIQPLSASTTTPTVNSQTVVLSSIPDYLLIYVKPNYTAPNQADWYLPILNISLQFDNFSGLLSSHTTEELYHMTIRNGIQKDINEYRGVGKKAGGGLSSTISGQAGQVGLVGSPLLIAPGRDFALSTGLASGVLGNFTLQFTLQLDNSKLSASYPGIPAAVPTSCTIYTVAIESGFFESKAGQSRVIKSVLTQSDVIEAPLAMEAPRRSDLKRMVGGAMDLSSMLSKAKDVYDVARAVAPVVKPMLPGKVRDAMSSVGLGVTGAGSASGGGRRMLSSRLM